MSSTGSLAVVVINHRPEIGLALGRKLSPGDQGLLGWRPSVSFNSVMDML
jgi:hypothetical protein